MENNLKPLLSIIVPFYNCEHFFNQCLQSLVNQTDQRFVAFLIDDGSIDGSYKIAEKFKNDHPDKFVLLHQENSGQGSARNRAFKLVNTKYVTFLDSDDYYGPRTVEHILNKLKDDTEVLFFNPTIYDMNSKEYVKWYDHDFVVKLFSDDKRLSTSTTPELLGTELSLNRCVWNVEFLKSIDFQYPENVKWEDIPPHYYALHAATKCDFLDASSMYFYRINSGIQSTSKINKTAFYIPLVFEQVLNKAKQEKWSKEEYLYILRFLNMYARWSISEVDVNNKKSLIKCFHKLYKRFSFSTISKLRKMPLEIKASKKDLLYAYMMQSKLLCSLYANENLKGFVKKMIRKVRGK